MSNTELFTSVAREYANFRPGYPPELFAWLGRAVPSRGAVWDCGCGSGQASVALAEHFEVVHATDVAAEQIAVARQHPRVRYSVAPAERSGLPDACVDLVTVAQALHWFDVGAFYAEARRVARDGALIAVWNYPRPEIVDATLDRLLLDFYRDVVGPYWPPERRHIEANYTTLPALPDELAITELPRPQFELMLDWNLDQVLGYVSSWSATARYRKANGNDPVPLLRAALAPAWPGEDARVAVRLALGLRVGRLMAGVGS